MCFVFVGLGATQWPKSCFLQRYGFKLHSAVFVYCYLILYVVTGFSFFCTLHRTCFSLLRALFVSKNESFAYIWRFDFADVL